MLQVRLVPKPTRCLLGSWALQVEHRSNRSESVTIRIELLQNSERNLPGQQLLSLQWMQREQQQHAPRRPSASSAFEAAPQTAQGPRAALAR